MQPVHIEGAIVAGESQGYVPLPVLHTAHHCEVVNRDVPCKVTAWLPTEEELRLINAGKPIFVSIESTVVHPMIVWVEDVKVTE
jgi:hypothetical protein